MTEDRIERIVEAKTNSLDRRYMAGELTEAEYHREMAALDRWAERQYRVAA